MSRRFSLKILLPIDEYDEDKIYDEDSIDLQVAYCDNKPDNIL